MVWRCPCREPLVGFPRIVPSLPRDIHLALRSLMNVKGTGQLREASREWRGLVWGQRGQWRGEKSPGAPTDWWTGRAINHVLVGSWGWWSSQVFNGGSSLGSPLECGLSFRAPIAHGVSSVELRYSTCDPRSAASEFVKNTQPHTLPRTYWTRIYIWTKWSCIEVSEALVQQK